MWQTLPGPSSSQDKSNSIACKNTSQAGKVRMAICWFLKHTLIQLQLQKKQSTAKRRWWNKWDKNECTDVERQEIRKTTKCEAEGGSERGGGLLDTQHILAMSSILTSLGWLRLEKTLRGQARWRCLEIQLRMLSQSTVPLGAGPSSLCNSTSCFCARTALPSNIRSNYRESSTDICYL